MIHHHWLKTIGILGVLTGLVLTSNPAWSAKGQSAAPLNEQEITDLKHMREEEKLARDVYEKMIEQWGLKIFVNIRDSEQTHMDQIKVLLERYGVEDPVISDEGGSFTDQYLRDLYDKLIEQGAGSIAEALEVGVIIENLDIEDLEKALNDTTHRDIRNVYSNLQEASGHHLEAFNNALNLVEALPQNTK